VPHRAAPYAITNGAAQGASTNSAAPSASTNGVDRGTPFGAAQGGTLRRDRTRV